MVDVDAYFHRIAHAGPGNPTLALLRDLTTRHLSEIAFENLDPFLGVPVELDPEALHTKLVRARRGGYCQEHNAVFHDVLAALGFSVTALGARVVWAFKGKPAPLTHRLTLVDLPEGIFIADVGFGGHSPTWPLRLETDIEQPTPHGRYRLERAAEMFELQLWLNGNWEALYQFNLAPQTRIDFEVANWYTSTNPRSLFTQNLIVCRVIGDTRVNLFNANLTTRQPDGSTQQRTLADAADLREVLEEVMNLALPAPADIIWAKLARHP